MFISAIGAAASTSGFQNPYNLLTTLSVEYLKPLVKTLQTCLLFREYVLLSIIEIKSSELWLNRTSVLTKIRPSNRVVAIRKWRPTQLRPSLFISCLCHLLWLMLRVWTLQSLYVLVVWGLKQIQLLFHRFITIIKWLRYHKYAGWKSLSSKFFLRWTVHEVLKYTW